MSLVLSAIRIFAGVVLAAAAAKAGNALLRCPSVSTAGRCRLRASVPHHRHLWWQGSKRSGRVSVEWEDAL